MDTRHVAPRSLRLRRLAAVGCASLAGACGVSSSGSEATSRDQPSTTGEGGAPSPVMPADPRSCGSEGPRQLAFLAEGECADVAGAAGRWIAGRLFPDAPPAVARTACSFYWSSREAPPEVAVLRALEPRSLTPNCAASNDVVAPYGTMTPWPEGRPAPTGVSGCDVCGLLADQGLYVILPPDKVDFRIVSLPTKTGWVDVILQPPASNAQAFTVALPPTPDGSAWVQGDLRFFKLVE